MSGYGKEGNEGPMKWKSMIRVNAELTAKSNGDMHASTSLQ